MAVGGTTRLAYSEATRKGKTVSETMKDISDANNAAIKADPK